MLILINKIILIGSTLGIFFILLKKIPLITRLPEVLSEKERKIEVFWKIKEKIKMFSWKSFLEKNLWRFKILILKMENFISRLIEKIRSSQKKEKEIEEDNYWDKIKK